MYIIHSVALITGLFAASLFTAVAGSSCGASVTGPSELVTNGGFESQASGWEISEGIMAVDTTVRHGGGTSLRISWDSAKQRKVARRSVVLKPGKRYEISAWMKCKGLAGTGKKAVFGLEWNRGCAYPAGVSGDSDWTQVRYLTCVIPDNATDTYLTFTLEPEATGTAWLDDVSVRELDPKPLVTLKLETPFVVGDVDSPPFRIKVEDTATDVLGDDSVVSIALCSPPWNAPLIEIKRAKLGTLELSTAKLPEGVYKLVCSTKTSSGQAIADPDVYTLYKRPPMQCLLTPHSRVALPKTKNLGLDITPYRCGTLSGTVTDANGNIIERLPRTSLRPDQKTQIPLPGEYGPGEYSVEVLLETAGAPTYSCRQSFTILSKEEASRGVLIGEDNILYRKGKRWFPMLVYADTAWNPDEAREMETRDPGFTKGLLDHLQGTPLGLMDYATPIGGLKDTIALADECARHGIVLALSVKDLYPDSKHYKIRAKAFPGKSPEQIVMELVEALKNHRALALYYTNDELGTQFFPALKDMRDWIHESDPLHPTLSVHYDLECISELSQTFDMLAPELYPWPNTGLTEMADWSRTCISKMPRTAPFWGCIFHFANDPNGSAKVRADAYIAIACGARGLLFYSYNDYIADKNSDRRWNDLVALAREIEERTPLLFQPELPQFCKSETAGLILRTVSGEFGTYLIAVNSNDRAVDADIRVPSGVTRGWEGETGITIGDQSIKLKFDPYQVRFIRLDAGK